VKAGPTGHSSNRLLPWTDVRGLSRVLLHGTPASRRAAALRLLRASDPGWWPLLAATVRSGEDWRLRARCLEVLGLAAGAGDRTAFEAIDSALFTRRGE
jgi:hypothetical protein